MEQGKYRSFCGVGLSAILVGASCAGGHPVLAASNDGSTRFELTKGREILVCRAYLQRLKNSRFNYYDHQPYCDRPENDSVPGFTRLVRIPLPPAEVNRLYPLAFNFETPPKTHEAETDGTRRIRYGQLDVTPNVGHELDVWRYEPEVDIFNNGAPVNVLMWRGVGLGGGPSGTCGVDLTGNTGGLRIDQMPLVFKSGNGAVDEAATKLLIAHPVQAYDTKINTGNLYATATGFRPVARSIGIFKYRDLYYFDGFFDIWGDANNERRGQPALANTLAVFLHRDGVSREICEYRLSGRDYPQP
jgi:hypothetical protein